MIKKEIRINSCAKINEKLDDVIDAVNKLHEEAENNARIRADHENLIDTLVAENNIHERQIDELQMKVNKLVSNINFAQPEVKENVQDLMIGCTTLDIPKSYKNDQLTLATLDYSKKLEKENSNLKDELERTREALDKGMEHITGLNNMIESWLKLIDSDLDQETKLHILKSAISTYVENKGGDNE